MEITCLCGGKFDKKEFKNHYRTCKRFIEKYKDFDLKISQILSQYFKYQKNSSIIKFLLKRYIKLIDNKMKSNNNIRIKTSEDKKNKNITNLQKINVDKFNFISNKNENKNFYDNINNKNYFNFNNQNGNNIYDNSFNNNTNYNNNIFNNNFNNNNYNNNNLNNNCFNNSNNNKINYNNNNYNNNNCNNINYYNNNYNNNDYNNNINNNNIFNQNNNNNSNNSYNNIRNIDNYNNNNYENPLNNNFKTFTIDYTFVNKNKTQYNSSKNNSDCLIKKNGSNRKNTFDDINNQEQDSSILKKFNHSGQIPNFFRPNLDNFNNIEQENNQNNYVNNFFFVEKQNNRKKSIYLENQDIYYNLVFRGNKFKIEYSDIIIYECKEMYLKNKGNIQNQIIKDMAIYFKKLFQKESKEYLIIISNRDSNEFNFGLSSVDDDNMIIFYYGNKIFIVINY